MKTLLLLGTCFLISIVGFSQKQFTLNSTIGTTTIWVNGIEYQANNMGVKVNTNYPKFDTLIFRGDASNIDIPIICNFKPDSAYSVSLACCGSLDIIPSSKFNNDSLSIWNQDQDFEKIQHHFMDQPYISIKTKRNPKDSIYAWHADAACMTEHKRINTSLWPLGIPPKCTYWNNITTIQFFKTDARLPHHAETEIEAFLQLKPIAELTSISFRLFDNERFVIIYNEKRNRIELDYE